MLYELEHRDGIELGKVGALEEILEVGGIDMLDPAILLDEVHVVLRDIDAPRLDVRISLLDPLQEVAEPAADIEYAPLFDRRMLEEHLLAPLQAPAAEDRRLVISLARMRERGPELGAAGGAILEGEFVVFFDFFQIVFPADRTVHTRQITRQSPSSQAGATEIRPWHHGILVTMKILVTGGAGLVGSHLVDRLVENGHDVIALDNFLTGDRKNLNPEARLVEQDITDADAILPVFAGIDAVFHTAGVARAAWGFDNPAQTAIINVIGTVNVLAAARAHNVRRFIHSSSYSVEQPINPYNISKAAAEQFVDIYRTLFGLSTISLRYANIYGPRQSESGTGLHIVASFRRSRREDGKIWITGDGSAARDMIHVNDVVRANLLALASDQTGHYDICTGKNITIKEIAGYFNCPIEYREAKKGVPQEFHPDPRPAEEAMGFRAQIAFSDGIKSLA